MVKKLSRQEEKEIVRGSPDYGDVDYHRHKPSKEEVAQRIRYLSQLFFHLDDVQKKVLKKIAKNDTLYVYVVKLLYGRNAVYST